HIKGAMFMSLHDYQSVENTFTTPATGQFQLLLPDGSKVWLNNASSLGYPLTFTGKHREVKLKRDMDEVVVQAYGHTTQTINTGNNPIVKATDIEKQSVMDPLI